MNAMNPQQQPHQPQANPMSYSKQSRAPWVILAVVIIVVLAAALFLFRDKLNIGAKKDSNVSDYQAVFLTNGQVYFGKLSDARDQYITLNDIYYLQVNQPLQQGQQAQQQAQPQLSLVKLGQELHGPVDEMHINRDQVLFYEQLKNDGKVVQAIKQYQQNGGNNASSNAPATQQQAPAQSTTPSGNTTK